MDDIVFIPAQEESIEVLPEDEKEPLPPVHSYNNNTARDSYDALGCVLGIAVVVFVCLLCFSAMLQGIKEKITMMSRVVVPDGISWADWICGGACFIFVGLFVLLMWLSWRQM